MKPKKPIFPDCLFEAIANNKPEQLRELLRQPGVNIAAIDQDGASLLAAAVSWNRNECIEVLLEAGADPDQRLNIKGKKSECVALIIAIQKDNQTSAKLLLEGRGQPPHPANANIELREGSTPLDFAAALGNVEMCRLLTSHGADVNLVHGDGTSLIVAAGRYSVNVNTPKAAGLVEVIDFLLSKSTPAAINHLTSKRFSALANIAKSGSKDLCERFLKHGALVDVPGQEYSPLEQAVNFHRKEAFAFLLTNGADRDYMCGQKTVFERALDCIEEEPYFFLALFQRKNPQHHKKTLEVLWQKDQPVVLAALIELGAVLNLNTLLGAAYSKGCSRVADYIKQLQARENVNHPSAASVSTADDVAAAAPIDEIAQIAASAPADEQVTQPPFTSVSADIQALRTELFSAIRAQNIDRCRELLSSILELNFGNSEKDNPLYVALAGTALPIVQLLLEHGANPRYVPEHVTDKLPPLHYLMSIAERRIELDIPVSGKVHSFRSHIELQRIATVDEEVYPIVECLIKHGAALEGSAESKRYVQEKNAVAPSKKPIKSHCLPGTHPDGVAILSEAAKLGLMRTCRLLMQHGVDLNFALNKYFPLVAAIDSRHPELADWMLDQGAIVNPGCSFLELGYDEPKAKSFTSPVEAAMLMERYSLCERILAMGGNPNILSQGQSLLCDAISIQDETLIGLFLKVKAMPDLPGQTNSALCEAAKQGDEQLCRRLLELGANRAFIADDEDGKLTAFDYAKKAKNVRLMAWLCAEDNKEQMKRVRGYLKGSDQKIVQLIFKLRNLPLKETPPKEKPPVAAAAEILKPQQCDNVVVSTFAEAIASPKLHMVELHKLFDPHDTAHIKLLYAHKLRKVLLSSFLGHGISITSEMKAMGERIPPIAQILAEHKLRQATEKAKQAAADAKKERKEELQRKAADIKQKEAEAEILRQQRLQEERDRRAAEAKQKAAEAEEAKAKAETIRQQRMKEAQDAHEIKLVVAELCDITANVAETMDDLVLQLEAEEAKAKASISQPSTTISVRIGLNEFVDIPAQQSLTVDSKLRAKSFVLSQDEMWIKDLRFLLATDPSQAPMVSQLVNQPIAPEGDTLLHRAAALGSTQLCRYLLDWGANVNATSNSSGTPLQCARRNKHEGLVLYLFMRGAVDPEINLLHPDYLIQAVRNGNVEGVRLILQKRREAQLPVAAVMEQAFLELGFHQPIESTLMIRQMLVEHGVFRYTVNGDTLLHRAVLAQDAGLVSVCLHHGADVFAINKRGYTPLMIAAETNNPLLCQSLSTVDNTQPDRCFDYYFAALDCAVRAHAHDTVQYLLGHLAQQGYSLFRLLEAAYQKKLVPLYDIFLAPSSINRVDQTGHTLLYWAAASGNLSLCSALLAKNADVAINDIEGLVLNKIKFARATQNVVEERKFRTLSAMLNAHCMDELNELKPTAATHPATMFGATAGSQLKPPTVPVQIERSQTSVGPR